MSLIELIVAIALLGLVVTTSAPALTQALHAWGDGAARVETQQATRIALERFAHDVRVAGFGGESFPAVAVAEPTRLVLQSDLDGNGVIAGSGETITWRLGTDVLRRDAGAGGQPIVNGVRALRFTYLDGAGAVTADPAAVRAVRVELTTAPTHAAASSAAGVVSTVATLVRLRNR